MRNRREMLGLVGLAMINLRTGWAAPKPKTEPLLPITSDMLKTAVNNMRQFGLAFHNLHDATGFLPMNYRDKDGKPLLSWRVAILPYVEETELFKEFRLNESWDSDHNRKLIEKMPKMYEPLRGRAEKHQTFYQMFAGTGTMNTGKNVRFANITDGLSNTIMVTEGADPVIWTKPDDIPFDGKTVPKLGGMFDGDFHVTMGDGSIVRVPKNIDANAMLAAITCNGGEVVDFRKAIEDARRQSK